MALPSAAGDKLHDESAKIALLAAARVLCRAGCEDEDPAEAVAAALVQLPVKERESRIAAIKTTQERVHVALLKLKGREGDITVEDVLRLMQES